MTFSIWHNTILHTTQPHHDIITSRYRAILNMICQWVLLALPSNSLAPWHQRDRYRWIPISRQKWTRTIRAWSPKWNPDKIRENENLSRVQTKQHFYDLASIGITGVLLMRSRVNDSSGYLQKGVNYNLMQFWEVLYQDVQTSEFRLSRFYHNARVWDD